MISKISWQGVPCQDIACVMQNNLKIQILPASLRDLGDLQRLEKACFIDDAWPLVDLVGVLMMPGVVRLKADLSGRMVGFVAGEIYGPQKSAWITTLGVLPAYRQRGIATALLQACEDQMNQPVIRLCVRRSNLAAIQLYKRESYRQVEVWAAYYNGVEDALVLEKRKG